MRRRGWSGIVRQDPDDDPACLDDRALVAGEGSQVGRQLGGIRDPDQPRLRIVL